MDNRVRVRTRRVPEVAVAALRVWLCGGERNAASPGVACLAGRMLEEGSVARDWRQVATAAEDRGVSIHAAGGYEVLGLALDGPAVEVDRMIEWAAELVRSPRFDPERWAWQRELAEAELAALRDAPDALTGWEFLRQLYGEHPRGRPLVGSTETLPSLAVEEGRRFHAEALAAGVVVSLTGAIDPEESARRITAAFDGASQDTPARPREPPPPADGPPRGVVRLPGDQAHLFLGKRTVPRAHPDLPALELAAVVLGAGAGLAGRIPVRVREREGLAYTASVDTAAGASCDEGRLVLYAATAPERVARAELVMREELERFVAEGVNPEELEGARAFLQGQEIFRRESARHWADLLVEAEFTGRAIDSPRWVEERWAGVGRADVRAAAERWLDPTALRVTLGLPEGWAGQEDAPG